MPAMDTVTGKNLEHCQLRHHPKYQHTWNELYANKLGHLCQGIGNGSKGPKNQRIKGTEIFQIIRYEDIPPPTDAKKSCTPKSSVNTGPKNRTLTKRRSPSAENSFATQEMLAC